MPEENLVQPEPSSWPEDQKHPLDEMSGPELAREMLKFFGPKRMMELIGWTVIAGLMSEVLTKGDPAQLRREMEASGFGTASSLYRALRDLRRFGEHMEQRAYPVHDHRQTLELMSRISQLRTTK